MLETYLKVVTNPFLWLFLILTLCVFGLQWLVSLNIKPQKFNKGWMRRNYVVILILAAWSLASLAVVMYLFEIGLSVRVLVDRLVTDASDPTTKAADLRNIATAVAVLMGVLAAGATIFFSVIRVWINERAATATEEGLITDRINKAVAGLGAEKTIKDADGERTVPNLEVRIGSIYALERIAQDSSRDHIQIMEILCAYVRNNCGERANKTTSDIETAMQVLGRRFKKSVTSELNSGFQLNLAGSNFYLIRMQNLDFSFADLSETYWFGCAFEQTNFAKCNFTNCSLVETKVTDSDFQSSSFEGAHLEDTSFEANNFEAVSFNGAQLEKCNFWRDSFKYTNFNKAYFWKSSLSTNSFLNSRFDDVEIIQTRFFQATFSKVQLVSVKLGYHSEFDNCDFLGAAFRKCILSNYSGMSHDFDGAYVHSNCSLSHDLKEALQVGTGDFHQEWRASQIALGLSPTIQF